MLGNKFKRVELEQKKDNKVSTVFFERDYSKFVFLGERKSVDDYDSGIVDVLENQRIVLRDGDGDGDGDGIWPQSGVGAGVGTGVGTGDGVWPGVGAMVYRRRVGPGVGAGDGVGNGARVGTFRTPERLRLPPGQRLRSSRHRVLRPFDTHLPAPKLHG